MAGAPVAAQDINWTACDGYAGVSRNADGVSRYANVLMNLELGWQGGIDRVAPGFGSTAINACTQALEALPSQHWRRRVSLLQARALHRAAIGHGDDALADLLLAEEAAAPGQSDPLFQRSQGVGLIMARAFVLDRMNRKDEALPLLLQARTLRPYDRGVTATVAALAGDKNASGAEAQIVHARLEPQGRSSLAMRLFDNGQFDSFMVLYPNLLAPRTNARAHELPVSVALRELRDHERAVQYRVSIESMAGYALTSLGRHEEAAEAFTKARAALVEGRETPTPPTLRGPAAEQYQRELAGSWNRIEPVSRMIEGMEHTATRRKMIADGQGSVVLESLASDPLPGDGAGFDTLLALAETLSEEEAAEARAAVEQQRLRLAAGDKSGNPALTLNDFFLSLPPAEIADGPLAWREARRPLLAMSGSPADMDAVGYRDRVGDNGIVTVRFRSLANPLNQVEEMALLRAAELARQGGHAGFVVVDRRDTAWSTQMTYMNIPGATSTNGFETEVDIRFVDATASVSDEMVLNADAVHAALGPAYIRERPRRR